VLTIRSAAVVNGVAVVEGGNAARGAPIFWEGARVTQANNGGHFAFQGVVPTDCVGRLEDGVPADAVDVALANCGPVSDTVAPVPQTGQTQCADSSGAVINCAGTGQDGEIQAGVPLPTPRFTDNGNGTVTDNLTGLIWLQNANCFGLQTWADALTVVHNLASGSCGLSDGSQTSDWRLPNVRELESLINFAYYPALPAGHPFSNMAYTYWSSTSMAGSPYDAWYVSLLDGRALYEHKEADVWVWPIRGPE
jgi:Protein of unknown function (DUF1566)